MKTRRPVRSLVSSTLWVTRLDNFGSAWSDTRMMMSMDEYRILEEAGCAFLPAADVRLDERKKKKKKILYSKKVVSLQHKNRLN